jgi:NAD(P)-dependent dehydrogenase (short-subunit alcohol dehydrogenase family)
VAQARITGVTDGLGLVAAELLADTGHCVILQSYAPMAAPSSCDGGMSRRSITEGDDRA